MSRAVWLVAVVLGAAGCSGRAAEAEPPPDPPQVHPAGPVVQASAGLESDLAATHAFSEGRPRFEQPLADGLTVPSGTPSLSAQDCGACHPAIQAEWATSAHAHAWRDAQYQAEITKSGNQWLCLNCHTPLLAQQARWPVGLQAGDVELPVLVENPVFDADLRDEGITCAACHVRDGTIHGPGLPDSTAPHPVVADDTFMTTQVCERCHQAVAVYPGKDFVCTFDTGNEWRAGPHAPEQGCADCHMPTVQRPAAVGGPVRTVRQHWWRGAGIPKVAGVLQPVAANPPGLGLQATWQAATLALVLTNERAGHLLPTGDPERWVQVDVAFMDASGAPVGEPWQARIGQRWEWWPEPKKLGDDRLAPGQSRTEELVVPGGAVAARVTASSHRMTAEAAGYHDLDDYPLSVVTHRLRVTPDGATGGRVEDPL